MKAIFAVILTVVVGSFCLTALAGDAVDLRDKKGIVDPKDLKKGDPKPPRVERQAPPPPKVEKAPDVPPFEVDRGGIDDANRPRNP
jgi:hypothetical protein